MSEHARIARAGRALSEMEELNGVFERLEAGIFRELKQTPIGADVKVQRLHLTLHNLAGIRSALQAMVDDGQVAQQALAVAGLNRPN